MKSFLTLTLAAGVAITGAQVVHAAGVNKAGADRVSSKSQVQAPGTIGTASSVSFDRNALNRELFRISEMLSPVGSTEDGLTEDRSVSKKAIGGMLF